MIELSKINIASQLRNKGGINKGEIAMRHYEQEREIIAMLNRHGVDLNAVVIGTGDNYVRTNHNDRFVFHIANRRQIVNETAKYAIKYFHSYGIYIMWEIRESNGSRYVNRTSLNVDAQAVMDAFDRHDCASKGVEFHWKESENVHIFNQYGLEQYIAENLGKLGGRS